MRENIQKEFWVGCLVLGVIALVGVFGWLMGVVGPFERMVRYDLVYGFAGGVEIGSPVRVAGIKVGKVEAIDFLNSAERTQYPGKAIKVRIGITARAGDLVRETSNFYVNMAGIIGERYVEVTPGDPTSSLLAANSVVAGIDPPRIDQLLSQGYGVFGKFLEFWDKNQKTITDFLDSMSGVMVDANKFLKGKDRQKLAQLINTLADLTTDLHSFTTRMKGDSTQQVIDELYEIIHRGNAIDKNTLKRFLQEEGIRARIF